MAETAEGAYDVAAGDEPPAPMRCVFNFVGMGPMAALSLPSSDASEFVADTDDEAQWCSFSFSLESRAGIKPRVSFLLSVYTPTGGGETLSSPKVAVVGDTVASSEACGVNVDGLEGELQSCSLEAKVTAPLSVDAGYSPVRLALLRSVSGTKRDEAPKSLLQRYGHYGGIGVLVVVQLVMRMWMKKSKMELGPTYKDRRVARAALASAAARSSTARAAPSAAGLVADSTSSAASTGVADSEDADVADAAAIAASVASGVHHRSSGSRGDSAASSASSEEEKKDR